MTMILLAVSVGCNLWFLFLLLYDRIMDTKIARFFKGIVKVWRSLEETEKGRQTAHTKLPASDNDIMGQEPISKWHQPGQNAAIPVQEAPFRKKGIELSEEEATFDDGNRKAATHSTQVPEDKLEETFTSMTPEEMEYGEDEPEDDASDAPRASGSSFDEIDDAVRTAKNPEATRTEREKAAKVFADMEGTELYDKMMEGSSEIAVRIKGLIEIRLKKPKKEFVVPDNIEEFDIRNYV